MHGYMGKILYIDLTTGELELKGLDNKFARKYIGGNGFAAKIIHDIVPPDTAPLSEQNAVVLATGPLNESIVWGTGRGHLASISPLTGLFGDSNFGGDFAFMLKRSGFDAVVITGKSEKPAYIMINNENVSIKDASMIWGKSTSETHSILREIEDERIETAVIGPAGENGVLFANIICSGKRVSAAGRCGIGAVMGSKNLKGLAVYGNQTATTADRESLSTLLKEKIKILKENSHLLTEMGTPFLVNKINEKGMLCTRNNTRETFEQANDISGETIRDKYRVKNTACAKCPVACGKNVNVPHGEFKGQHVKMPEYESIYALGSMLENSDIVSIFNANNMCDEMGIDTISMGVTLAFAAECFEKKVLEPDENNLKISFGNNNNIAELIKKTANKEGIGKLLSSGSWKMAEEIGNDSWKMLYAVKGLEIAGHSARGLRSMSLGYATSNRGGSHHDARPKYPLDEEDPGFDIQPEYCVQSENFTAVGDSLVLCRFVMEQGFGREINDTLCSVLNHVTGWDITREELIKTGERIYNLERLINIKRGLKPSMDIPPYRVLNEPIPDGPKKGALCPEDEFKKMIKKYYSIRGWDSNGVPTESKLQELEIL